MKVCSENFKHSKSNHFSNLENTTFKSKYFQVFPAPVRTLGVPKTLTSDTKQNLLVALQLACRGHGEEAVGSGVVDERAGQQEPGEEPAEGVTVLLEEHQHPVHGLDAQGVVT